MGEVFAPGGLLAIDYGGTTGWAYGHLADPKPRCGHFILASLGGEGGRYNSFEHKLVPLMERLQPVQIVMASPLPMPAQHDIIASRQLFFLRGAIIREAWNASASVYEHSEADVRRDILGRRYFPKNTVKDHVMAWCRKRGWKVVNDHEGDACVLWEWYRRQLTGGQMAAGPLFADTAALQVAYDYTPEFLRAHPDHPEAKLRGYAGTDAQWKEMGRRGRAMMRGK